EGLHAQLRHRIQPPAPPDPELEQMRLLMLAKGRFDSIQVHPDHAQVKGLTHLLQTARSQRWKFLLFYARENPDDRDGVISPVSYQAHREELRQLIAPLVGRGVVYHEGETSLPGAHYLDHVHVDAVGYERLAETLWQDIRALARGR